MELASFQLVQPAPEVRIVKLTMWLRFVPIAFFVTYLTFTVLFFAFGPFDFPVENPFMLYGFLAAAHIALLAGYWRAARSQPRGYAAPWDYGRMLLWGAVLSLLLLLPTSLARTGSLIPDVAYGIENPGEAYAQTQAIINDPGSFPLVEYSRILVGPLLVMVLPLTVFYWESLTTRLRVLGVVSILGTVALFLAMGTNKAIADTVLLIPWMVFAGYRAGTIHLKLKRLLVIGICTVVAFSLFLGFFGLAMATRSGSPAVTGVFPATGSTVDSDNVLVRNLSDTSKAIVMGLDIYLTAGYYAVSLSLREPYVPMFGLGNSTFASRQFARFSSLEDFPNRSYPVRIEKYGWDSVGLWSTIYPWLASDVSFPGALILIYFIGRLFALSWLDTLGGTNPFAVVLFAQLVIMLFYFPANNQLLQSGEGFTAFWITLILWWRSRRNAEAFRTRVVTQLA
jgi:hypothetical protein